MKIRCFHKKYIKINGLSAMLPVASEGLKLLPYKKSFKLPLNIFCLFVAFCFFGPQVIMAASVTLSWNRNQEPDIAGYKIFYGTASHQYSQSETINDSRHSPLEISHVISNLDDGKTYYFAVKAFDLAGQTSDFSDEISITIPSSTSGSGGDEGSGGSDDSGSTGDSGGDDDTVSGPMEFKVNFQPANAPIPSGFAADSGQWYSSSTGYGWVGQRPQVYDLNSRRSKDQQHDTLAKVNSSMKWELAVPAGDYEVTVCIGSPTNQYLFQGVYVEGNRLFYNTTTWAGKWMEKTTKVHVSDGKLTLSFKNILRFFVALDYVIVRSEDTGVSVHQNQPPIPVISTSTRSGQAPFEVQFNGSGSSDPDGSIVLYHWDFGDGETLNGAVTSHVFSSPGSYTVRLTVKDDDGLSRSKTVTITATGSDDSGSTGDSGGDDDTVSGPMEFKVNFQPANAPIPSGFAADSGQWYSSSTGYGWVGQRPQVYDLNSRRSKDQQHDTLAKVNSSMKWELAVPAGDYEVTVCVGSATAPYFFQGVQVEGKSFFSGLTTFPGHWEEKTRQVHVSDGKLTLKFFTISRSFVALDYVIVKKK